MNGYLTFWLVLWTIVGFFAFCANLSGWAKWSKKQTVFALLMGGPLVWAFAVIGYIIEAFIWLWKRLA